MAYDEDLANRIRELLGAEKGVEEKRMVRVPPDETDKLLDREHVEPMVMAGRQTRGRLRVAGEGVYTKRRLQSWVGRGVEYAKSLPPK